MMSLAKTVPNGLKIASAKGSPYANVLQFLVSEKDSVQETVPALKAESRKTQIGEGMELCIYIWHSGTREVFLMHVRSAMDAIKKQGHFKAHKEAHAAYVEQRNLVKQAKAALAEIDGTTSESATASTKSTTKHKDSVATADASEPNLQAIYQLDLEKAKEAAENARAKAESTAKDIFQFYANLLSVDAKYVWNKIIQEQTQSDPYTDLQGISKKGPRGLLYKLIDDCVMFHLLTVFPNNAAEQERYYLMNVLKKPQCVSVHQFVQRVKQLNSYIMQLPCWFYSPSVKPTTILVNVPFTKADLASHVLRMCPLMWRQVQPSQERYDSCGHAFASHASQGYRVHMHTEKVQCTIRQQSFQ
jgi:hypothetical protein